jgi:ketosteroid isomerase-like protein
MTYPNDEAAIRALIANWADAICVGDIERIVADRTDDVVMFDVPAPIQEKGIHAYRDTWTLFFRHTAAGPDRFRISELEIVIGDEVAFAHGLLTINGGAPHCRLTLGLKQLGGRWQVSHEHHSIPIERSQAVVGSAKVASPPKKRAAKRTTPTIMRKKKARARK